MVARGERIGTAYVKLLLDGSGADRSAERQMSDLDPVFEKAGEDHSETYWDAFEKESKKNDKFIEGMEKKVDKFRPKWAAMMDLLGGDAEQIISDHIAEVFQMSGVDEERARKLGQRAGELWSEGFARSGNRNIDFLDLMSRSFASLEAEERKAAAEAEKLAAKIAEAGDGQLTFNKRIKEFSDGIGRSFGKGSRNDFLNFIGSAIGGLVHLTGRLVNIGGVFEKVSTSIGNLVKSGLSKIPGLSDEAAASLGKMGGSLASSVGVVLVLVGLLGPVAGLISGLAAAITALASSVAFALSAGLGVFVGLLPLVAGGLAAVVIAFKGLKDVTGFSDAMKPLKDDFGALQKILAGGLAKGIEALVKPLDSLFDSLRQFGLLKLVGDSLGEVARIFARFLSSQSFHDFVLLFAQELPIAIEQFGLIFKNIIGAMGGIFQAVLPQVQDFLGWVTGLTDQFNQWANSAKGQSWLKDFFDKAAESAKTVGKFIGKIAEAIGALLFSNAGRKAGDSIFGSITEQIQNFIDMIDQARKDGSLAQWFQDGKDVIGAVGDALKGLVDIFNALDTPENRNLAVGIFSTFADVATVVATLVGWLVKVDTWLAHITGFDKFLQALAGTFHIIATHVQDLGPTFKKVSHAVEEWWKNLKKRFGQSADAVGDFAGAVKRFFGKVADAIRSAGTKIQQWWDDLRGIFGKAKNAVASFAGSVKDFFGRIADTIRSAGDKIQQWWDRLRGIFGSVKDGVVNLVQAFGDWLGRLPDIAARAAEGIVNKFTDLAGKVIRGAGNIVQSFADWLGDLPGKAAEIVQEIANAFIDLPSMIISAIGSIDLSDIPITLPDLPGPLSWSDLPGVAAGGVFTRPTLALIGESGPEAVVPLSRNLAMVDPSVRALSSMAQGQATTTLATMPTGRSVDVGGITIITPTEDPAAVAQETINRLVGSTYF